MSEKKSKVEKTNKSEKMRELFKSGVSISEIAKTTNSHYSFVYETCKKFARKSNLKFETNQIQTSKKADTFRKMFDDGCTIGQIAKDTNSNYSYVWTVVEKYRNS